MPERRRVASPHWERTLHDLALIVCIRRHGGERTVDPDGEPCLGCLEAVEAAEDALELVVDTAVLAGFRIGVEDVAAAVRSLAVACHQAYRALRDVYRGQA